MNHNYILFAVKTIGSYNKTADLCGVTPRAVRKWAEAGKLPRTEATGETKYSEVLSAANPKIKKEKLLATVMCK